MLTLSSLARAADFSLAPAWLLPSRLSMFRRKVVVITNRFSFSAFIRLMSVCRVAICRFRSACCTCNKPFQNYIFNFSPTSRVLNHVSLSVTVYRLVLLFHLSSVWAILVPSELFTTRLSASFTC